ncbi:DUF2589 domain-containing protein [Xanthomonas sp. Kuri4-1]
MADIVNMSDQFKGLPMGDLIGAPLRAACDAQVMLARATADFIKVIGFLPPTDPNDPNGNGGTRTAQFKFMRPVEDPAGNGKMAEEEVEIVVPLLALVNVPNLSIQTVDVTFDMEVKSSFSEKEAEDKSLKVDLEASVGWGVFKAKVNVQGSVSTHKENTRSSDNSAKYHVALHAEDRGTPEGLARVLDILQTAAAPRQVKEPVPVP